MFVIQANKTPILVHKLLIETEDAEVKTEVRTKVD